MSPTQDDAFDHTVISTHVAYDGLEFTLSAGTLDHITTRANCAYAPRWTPELLGEVLAKPKVARMNPPGRNPHGRVHVKQMDAMGGKYSVVVADTRTKRINTAWVQFDDETVGDTVYESTEGGED